MEARATFSFPKVSSEENSGLSKCAATASDSRVVLFKKNLGDAQVVCFEVIHVLEAARCKNGFRFRKVFFLLTPEIRRVAECS